MYNPPISPTSSTLSTGFELDDIVLETSKSVKATLKSLEVAEDISQSTEGHTDYVLHITEIQGQGLLRVSVPAAFATDAAGNAFPPSSITILRDTTPPRPPKITSAIGKVINTDSVTLTIDFGEPVLRFNENDLELHLTGGMVGRLANFSVISDGLYHVNVISLQGEGTLSVLFLSEAASDLAGNYAAGASIQITRDLQPPSQVSIWSPDLRTQKDFATVFVQFNEPVVNFQPSDVLMLETNATRQNDDNDGTEVTAEGLRGTIREVTETSVSLGLFVIVLQNLTGYGPLTLVFPATGRTTDRAGNPVKPESITIVRGGCTNVVSTPSVWSSGGQTCVAQTCPPLHYRCALDCLHMNLTCPAASTQCEEPYITNSSLDRSPATTTSSRSSPTTYDRCPDGTCGASGKCPDAYFGCPPAWPVLCSDGRCVGKGRTCSSTSYQPGGSASGGNAGSDSRRNLFQCSGNRQLCEGFVCRETCPTPQYLRMLPRTRKTVESTYLRSPTDKTSQIEDDRRARIDFETEAAVPHFSLNAGPIFSITLPSSDTLIAAQRLASLELLSDVSEVTVVASSVPSSLLPLKSFWDGQAAVGIKSPAINVQITVTTSVTPTLTQFMVETGSDDGEREEKPTRPVYPVKITLPAVVPAPIELENLCLARIVGKSWQCLDNNLTIAKQMSGASFAEKGRFTTQNAPAAPDTPITEVQKQGPGDDDEEELLLNTQGLPGAWMYLDAHILLEDGQLNSLAIIKFNSQDIVVPVINIRPTERAITKYLPSILLVAGSAILSLGVGVFCYYRSKRRNQLEIEKDNRIMDQLAKPSNELAAARKGQKKADWDTTSSMKLVKRSGGSGEHMGTIGGHEENRRASEGSEVSFIDNENWLGDFEGEDEEDDGVSAEELVQQMRSMPGLRQITPGELCLGELIGEGSYKSVFKGVYDKEGSEAAAPVAICAIKFSGELHQSAQQQQRIAKTQTRQFMHEVEIAVLLGEHPNIINFQGVCFEHAGAIPTNDTGSEFGIDEHSCCSSTTDGDMDANPEEDAPFAKEDERVHKAIGEAASAPDDNGPLTQSAQKVPTLQDDQIQKNASAVDDSDEEELAVPPGHGSGSASPAAVSPIILPAALIDNRDREQAYAGVEMEAADGLLEKRESEVVANENEDEEDEQEKEQEGEEEEPFTVLPRDDIQHLRLSLVTELCMGSLYDVLYRFRRVLTESERKQIAYGTINGIAHIHARRMIHRDLKTQNILLTDSLQAKLADFGTVKLRKFSHLSTSGQGYGTPGYMAPEQFLITHTAGKTRGRAATYKVTEKSDMWAFGCVLVELFTGLPPWTSRRNVRIPRNTSQTDTQNLFIPPEARAFFTSDHDPKAIEIAKACLNFVPDQRPAAFQILTQLQNLEWFGPDDKPMPVSTRPRAPTPVHKLTTSNSDSSQPFSEPHEIKVTDGSNEDSATEHARNSQQTMNTVAFYYTNSRGTLSTALTGKDDALDHSKLLDDGSTGTGSKARKEGRQSAAEGDKLDLHQASPRDGANTGTSVDMSSGGSSESQELRVYKYGGLSTAASSDGSGSANSVSTELAVYKYKAGDDGPAPSARDVIKQRLYEYNLLQKPKKVARNFKAASAVKGGRKDRPTRPTTPLSPSLIARRCTSTTQSRPCLLSESRQPSPALPINPRTTCTAPWHPPHSPLDKRPLLSPLWRPTTRTPKSTVTQPKRCPKLIAPRKTIASRPPLQHCRLAPEFIGMPRKAASGRITEIRKR